MVLQKGVQLIKGEKLMDLNILQKTFNIYKVLLSNYIQLKHISNPQEMVGFKRPLSEIEKVIMNSRRLQGHHLKTM